MPKSGGEATRRPRARLVSDVTYGFDVSPELVAYHTARMKSTPVKLLSQCQVKSFRQSKRFLNKSWMSGSTIWGLGDTIALPTSMKRIFLPHRTLPPQPTLPANVTVRNSSDGRLSGSTRYGGRPKPARSATKTKLGRCPGSKTGRRLASRQGTHARFPPLCFSTRPHHRKFPGTAKRNLRGAVSVYLVNVRNNEHPFPPNQQTICAFLFLPGRGM